MDAANNKAYLAAGELRLAFLAVSSETNVLNGIAKAVRLSRTIARAPSG